MEIIKVENNELDFLVCFCHFENFCYRFLDLDKEIFYLNSSRIIFEWAKNYFLSYNKPIDENIKNIFDSSKKNIKEIDSEYIEEFIIKFFQAKSFINNEEFQISIFNDFIKRRKIEILNSRLSGYLSLNNINEAFNEIIKFDSSKDSSNFEDINPFDNYRINSFFSVLDENILFKYRGKIGDLFGNFKRGWLVTYLAPMKRGKSWFLLETAIQALINKLKVVFISLEMDEVSVLERIYKRFLSSSSQSNELVYPCFDCYLNQNGKCRKSLRKNKVSLLDSTGKFPEYNIDMRYNICTECRNSKDFVVSSWFKTIRRPIFDATNVNDKMKALKQTISENNFRIKCYPKFSATIEDIENYLNFLHIKKNFAADVVVLDYGGILNNKDRGLSERGKVDDNWKKFGNMSLSRKLLFVTAGQTNRDSIEARSLKEKDTAEDIRIIAHSDIVCGINQDEKEKERLISRVNIVSHRHKKFNNKMQALVLQQFEAGQTIIDSEIIFS